MPLQLKNLITKEVVIVDTKGKLLKRLPPSETEYIAIEETCIVDDLDGVPVFARVRSIIPELPHPRPNTVYVAPLAVAKAAKALGRDDVYYPGRAVIDKNGVQVACVGLRKVQ